MLGRMKMHRDRKHVFGKSKKGGTKGPGQTKTPGCRAEKGAGSSIAPRAAGFSGGRQRLRANPQENSRITKTLLAPRREAGGGERRVERASREDGMGSRRRVKGVRAEQGGQKAEKGKERKAQKLSLGDAEKPENGGQGGSAGGAQ